MPELTKIMLKIKHLLRLCRNAETKELKKIRKKNHERKLPETSEGQVVGLRCGDRIIIGIRKRDGSHFDN